MKRKLCLIAIAIACFNSKLIAAPVVLDFSKTTYVPGQEVRFEIKLPLVTELASFNIDILFQTETPVALADFSLDETDITPAATNYVFPSEDNFLPAVNEVTPQQFRLTASDFSDVGTDVVLGINDSVATIRLATSSAYTGDLVFSVDADNLFLDDFDLNPVSQQAAIVASTRAQSPVRIRVVPEPSSLALVGAVSYCFAFVRRRRRVKLVGETASKCS